MKRTLRAVRSRLGVVCALSAALAICACSSSPSPSGIKHDPPQQSANGLMAVTQLTYEMVAKDVSVLSSLGISGAGYSNGWWHVTLSFDLKMGAKGTLALDLQWLDKSGKVVQFPLSGISKMVEHHDLNAQLFDTAARLTGDTTLTNLGADAFPKDLGITGSGSGTFGYGTIAYDIADFRMSPDQEYPTGAMTATLDDLDLGLWNAAVTFDGTYLVEIRATANEAAMVMHLNLKCGCLEG
ncbi:MAG: hypothetical protein HYV63_34525 [Candidatus Schekmanbacteria bacterium]|nr:hypothetical protein [Candidatus Schekmanbacteria bacterium]